MSENKRKKKKKRRTKKSQKQKKIDVVYIKEHESKVQPFQESLDRRSHGGTFSDCYRMIFSRITNAFARRDRDATHAGTIRKADAMSQTSFPSTLGRLSRKDIFDKEIPSRRDLFETIEELCKNRFRPYIEDELPMMKYLYHDVDYYVTSVLIEVFNNEPSLSKDNPMLTEFLNNIINGGMICDMNLQTIRKKQNRRYTHKKTHGSYVSDCRVSQDIRHKTRYPKFLNHPPCSLCRFLRTTLGRTTHMSGKESDVSEGPENWAETLPSPLRRQYQPKLTKDPLADITIAQTKTLGSPSKRIKRTEIIRPSLIGRIEARDNSRNIENYVSQKCRLKLNTGNRINLSEGYSLESTALVSTSQLHHMIDRNLQYAIKTNRMISRIVFAIGRETYTIFMNKIATESFWRLTQRLVNSFPIQRPATTDAVLQYRPCKRMTNITVDLPETGSLTITSVPVSVIKLLLHILHQRFTTVCTPSVVVGRYQVPECCRYRSTSKRLYLRNENQRIYIENLRDTLQLKHGFSFWRHFPYARDIHIVWKSSSAALDNGTAATKEKDCRITDEIYTPGAETTSEHFLDDRSYTLPEHPTKTVEVNSGDMYATVDIPGDQTTESYDSETYDVCINLAEREGNGSESDEATIKNVCASLDTLEDKGAAAPKSFTEEYAEAKEDAKAKDYQNFNNLVPDNLLHIKIPFIDVTELDFETDMDGNRVIIVSGGYGDICQASLSTTEEKVIVKIVKNMTFEDVLRETRIQAYLMSSVCVPVLLGIIGGPGHAETMIIQQMCAKGRTLYDLIEACLAESVVLFDKQWLGLCYQLAINLENMHDKGILHNDIKTDNILVELKPKDVRIYFIDFGQATFRSGGILHFDEDDISDDTEDYLAPEVCNGLQSSPKSDIYSLGIIFADIADEFCECLGQLADDMCEQEPTNRPTLEEITDTLEELIMEYE